MNKSELIAAAAEAAGVTKKDAERVLNAAIDTVTHTLRQGGKVQISGFGVFEARDRKPRVGRNPVTREAVDIPAGRVPAFKPSQSLKDIVGGNK
ncbi:MAG: HU family DNA-binding protein [Firmicutes bacterium]|nr:HU family DNA-binding protein [Bacillota bacterium]